MTPDQFLEYAYRYQERVAILTDGQREPTEDEMAMARVEAENAVNEINQNEN